MTVDVTSARKAKWRDRAKIWYADPICFAADTLPRCRAHLDRRPRGECRECDQSEQPTYAQCELLDSIANNKQTVSKAHRGWGKSRSAAYAALWWVSTRANSLTFTLAPVWEQALQGVWVEIRHLWSVSNLPTLVYPTWRCLTSELLTDPLTPKWRITSAAASDVQNIEGRHSAKGRPTLVISDESKKIGDDFRYSLEGMLSNSESRFFGIGTPGIPMGWFFDAFGRNATSYKTFSFRADESPDPAVRAQAAKMAREMGVDDPQYRQQWLAEFTGADEGVIIPLSIIEPAIGRGFEYLPSWPRVLSLDPAGEGPDDTVLTYRWGPIILAQVAWQGWDLIRSERKVIGAIRDPRSLYPKCPPGWTPDIVVIDEGGLGQGVVYAVRSALRNTDIKIISYKGGSPARDVHRFTSKKAEDVFALRDRFREGALFVESVKADLLQAKDANQDGCACSAAKASTDTKTPCTSAIHKGLNAEAEKKMRSGVGISIPRDQQLTKQLMSWVAEESTTSKTRVIDPDDSPDKADSLMMAFAIDHAPVPMKGHAGAKRIIG